MLGAVIVALACVGCAADPPPADPERYEPVLGRAEVRALGDYLQAVYALRAAGEGRLEAPDPAALEADLAQGRDALRDALIAAGADPERVADEANLLPVAHEAAQRGDRYAFVFAADQRSFALVRLRTRRRRERAFFGEAFAYTLLEFDEVLVPDYPTHLGGGAPRPASYSSAGRVRVDYAAIVEIGKRQFLPQAQALVDAIHVPDEAFLERSGDAQALELLRLTKAVLRGRSVEPLWSRLQPRTAEERLQGFVQDYAAHAELRAAAELFALGSSPDPTQPDPGRLAQRGALVAMLHDEPLGHLADLVGLAIVAVETESEHPALLAARALLVEFLAELHEGEAPGADARACARLARMSAKELRDLAQALWNKRAK